jgi:crotonobetainyl-CoA:carnitine CoA-transferase CaiB-like acyl-CoA transferase
VPPAERPYEGLRVVELGSLVSVPFCGMMLGDLGAEVIKVEPPAGDMAREFGPFVGGESAFFLSVNRHKRSVVLDLKDARARRWLLELVDTADVLLHNFRVGVAERLGLGYDAMAERNPRLVYCAVSAFGPDGPDATRPGVDLIFQAESGMLSVTGEPGGGPVKIGTNAADVHGATTAAACIGAALHQRGRTGRGCRVDVSLRDALLALQACWAAIHLSGGEQPPRLGTASPFTAPTEVFQAADGPVAVAVVNERHWQRFCAALDLGADVAADPRYGSNVARVEHRAELAALLAPRFAARTVAEWVERFGAEGIPVGRVMDYAEVFADAQVRDNGMLIETEHPRAGTIRLQGAPYAFDGERVTHPGPPPPLGAHTAEVLAGLGCPAEEISALAAPGGQAPVGP